MKTQVEAKFLNTDHDTLRGKLEQAGAARERPMRSMRRVVMDFPDGRLKANRNGWVRIRDEGYTVTLTYKQIDNWAPSGVRVAEVVVAGFDAAKNVLEAIGMEAKAYQETKHETWKSGEMKVILSEWPYLQPFCELEGEDEAEVRRMAVLLGLDWEEAVFGNIDQLYMSEYDITTEDFARVNDLTFVAPIPQLLALKKREDTGAKRRKAAA